MLCNAAQARQQVPARQPLHGISGIAARLPAADAARGCEPGFCSLTMCLHVRLPLTSLEERELLALNVADSAAQQWRQALVVMLCQNSSCNVH